MKFDSHYKDNSHKQTFLHIQNAKNDAYGAKVLSSI